jgi:ABC-type phosphate transport system ATPase subunit
LAKPFICVGLNPFPVMPIRDNVMAGLMLQGVRNHTAPGEAGARLLKAADSWNEVKDQRATEDFTSGRFG